MTFYQKLETLLKYKDAVCIENKQKLYFWVSCVKDDDGNFRESKIEKTKELAFSTLGSECGAEEERWNYSGNSFTIVDSINFKHERYQVGQKVRVREDAEEWFKNLKMEWNEEEERMVGKIYEIIENEFDQYDVEGVNFPHEALDPVFEDDPKEEWLKQGQSHGWVKDGKVIS